MSQIMENMMKRIQKTAVFATALCLAVSILASCGSKVDVAEYYELIKTSCNSALAIESGEILVYESITADSDMENGYATGSVETYVRFEGNETPDFELSSTKITASTGDYEFYELIKDGDTVIELIDGEGKFAENVQLPDIFENFRVEFTAQDVKSIEIEQREKGVKCYKLIMKSAYIDSFDTETAEVSSDCTALTYSFCIDSLKRLEKVVCEMTLTVSANGQTQKVVRVIDSEIA